jgi:ABC-type amino acid transport substrate-binding protein
MLTPYRLVHVLSRLRGALLTALATGKLFAVLPMISSGVQSLLRDRDVSEEEAHASTDMLVPLAYPFPNAGKILIALFIPFSAWYVGTPLDLADYPLLLSVGLLSLFGSPVAAIPFLLDLQRLPADLISLFLVAGIWCSRLGDVLGAMHLAVFTLLCDSWNRGWLQVQRRRFVVGSVLIVLLGAGALWLNHVLVAASIRAVPPMRDRVAGMDLLQQVADIVEGPAPLQPDPSETFANELERIRAVGELRVGYVPRNPPFSYRNDQGRPVGLDVDLAQHLASNLGVRVRAIAVGRDSLFESLQAGTIDIAIGGITSSLDYFGRFFESTAYLDLHAALVVADHRVKEFETLQAIRDADEIVLGYLKGGRLARSSRQRLPNLTLVEVESPEVFLRGERPDVDALLTTAEAGAIYSMFAPSYSVVIPAGVIIRVPVVIAARIDPVFNDYLDTWIRLKQGDGTIDALYEHWILGHDETQHGPRWSVIRNVLGWVD